MSEIGAFEAKNKLSQLLDRVAAGEDITITRRGKPVALLIPPKPAIDPAQAQNAAHTIREMSRTATLAGLKPQDLIAEGRQ